MGTVRLAAILGALALPALLGALSLTAGLGAAGWFAGLTAGWAATAFVVVGRLRSEPSAILPADWVTLTRALLTAGVAGLLADSSDRPLPVTPLVVLSTVALVLDTVDGRVARRTGTATRVGARFDCEVDAFLILLLSIAVARDYGAWVLAIGAARYVLLVAGWPVRWLAAPLPPRYWGKVVAAVQGIALTVAASGVLPRPVGVLAVAVALVLLAESFGRSILWLYRAGAGPGTRRVVRVASALAAAAVVWTVLVAPTRLDRLTPAAFARIPLEGLALVAIGLLLPPRPRRVAAAGAGIVLSLLAVVKILDLGFNEHLGRPFNPVLDWGSFGPAVGVVRDSLGDDATDVLLVLTGLGVALLAALVTASAVRISSVTARHRRRSVGGAAVLAVAWVLSAALSLQLVPGAPVASTSSADLAVDRGRAVQETVRDQQRFRVASSSADPYADIPADDLLTDLRGKTVLVAFVESYGRSAVEGTSYARGVTEVLRNGNAELASAGLSARSAFLDSPTFGGASWLAHATLQSGLWISDQQRYDQLLASPRFTLSVAFGKAGWRTVGFNPANRPPWPAGASFYRFDQLYHRYNVGYEGPRFSWAAMPDQFALAAFERLELAPGHRPVMAEIDLVTSHQPWTPLPDVVPWDQLGDGSIFEPMAARGLTPDEAWRDTETVRRLYGQSIEYSLQVLVDWVVNLDDEDVVLVLLGDHQPIAKVSGPEANHQVPVSVVAHDPAVLESIDAWEWEEGLLPGPTAPVWRMSDFRNAFLEAFSTPAPPR